MIFNHEADFQRAETIFGKFVQIDAFYFKKNLENRRSVETIRKKSRKHHLLRFLEHIIIKYQFRQNLHKVKQAASLIIGHDCS